MSVKKPVVRLITTWKDNCRKKRKSRFFFFFLITSPDVSREPYLLQLCLKRPCHSRSTEILQIIIQAVFSPFGSLALIEMIYRCRNQAASSYIFFTYPSLSAGNCSKKQERFNFFFFCNLHGEKKIKSMAALCHVLQPEIRWPMERCGTSGAC